MGLVKKSSKAATSTVAGSNVPKGDRVRRKNLAKWRDFSAELVCRALHAEGCSIVDLRPDVISAGIYAATLG